MTSGRDLRRRLRSGLTVIAYEVTVLVSMVVAALVAATLALAVVS